MNARRWAPSAEEWAVLEPLVDAVLDLPLAERAQFADRHFGATPELRTWIDRLLAGADDDALLARLDPSLLESDAPDEGAGPRASAMAHDDRFGPYRAIRELGHGGMGIVYLGARRDGQFEQRVAIKVVGRGLDSDEARQRFLTERRILATLEHPNVARLVDGGIRDDGLPWFAMEFVEGERIDQWCNARRLDVTARLRLFLAVCDAVQAAHQRLVVHRDLKPSNILVTGDGSVRLLDFGIATLLDAPQPGEATRRGHLVFTPEYAAPEQWTGAPATTATDCYALGALLYELLAGVTPHALHERSEGEWRDVVLHVRPAPPSTRITAAAARARGTTPERLQRRLQGDLDTITLMALRPEPTRRYATVQQLADDLRRHLEGHPVSARADTWRYRTSRFVRRNVIGVSAAAAVVLAIVGGGAAALWQARRAEQAAAEATAVSDFLAGIFLQASPLQARGDSLTALELLDRSAATLDSALADRPRLHLRLLLTVTQIYRDLGAVARADTLARRAVALADSTLGAGSGPGVWALGLLADVTRARGEYARADSLMTSAIDRARRYNLPDSLLARLLDGRGSIRYRLQRFAPAESAHREAVARGRALGPAFLGPALNNLALVLDDAGRDAEADSVYAASMRVLRGARLTDHPDYLLALGNRATLLDERWELDSARVLKEEVLARMRRIYPNGHDRVVIALNNLAYGLLLAGAWEPALRGFAEAAAMTERLHGTDYPFALVIRNNMGRALLLGGHAVQAESTFRAVRAAVRERLGADHPYVGMASLALGRALAAQGRAVEALATLDGTLDQALRLFPATHPRATDVRALQGEVLFSLDRLAEADSVLRLALAWRRHHLAPRDPDVAATALLLGRVVARRAEASGDPALQGEATTLLREAAERYARTSWREAARRDADDALRRWLRRTASPGG